VATVLTVALVKVASTVVLVRPAKVASAIVKTVRAVRAKTVHKETI
jgi:hypothetical protein